MLIVKSLFAYYDRIEALHGISLHVSQGEIVTLIGANGAGKTTLLSTISGLLPQWQGDIIFADESLIGKGTEQIVGKGISMVAENREIFSEMTVAENLALGAYLFYKRNEKQRIQEDLDKVFELFPRLKERRSQLAGTLSGGEQQMLAIARALMSRPRLLMLDEPSLGLAPLVIKEIYAVVPKLREQGLTVLLVEQNARLALSVADRGYVLENGRIILQGSSDELIKNNEVVRAYLGRSKKGFLDGR